MSLKNEKIKERFEKFREAITPCKLDAQIKSIEDSIICRNMTNFRIFKRELKQIKEVLRCEDYLKMLLVLDTYKFTTKDFLEVWNSKDSISSFFVFINNLSPFNIKHIKN